jgi:hypothetical protein
MTDAVFQAGLKSAIASAIDGARPDDITVTDIALSRRRELSAVQLSDKGEAADHSTKRRLGSVTLTVSFTANVPTSKVAAVQADLGNILELIISRGGTVQTPLALMIVH